MQLKTSHEVLNLVLEGMQFMLTPSIRRKSKEIVLLAYDKKVDPENPSVSQYTAVLIEEGLISKEPSNSETKTELIYHYRSKKDKGDLLEVRLRELINNKTTKSLSELLGENTAVNPASLPLSSVLLTSIPEHPHYKEFSRLPLPFDFLCRVTMPSGLVPQNQVFAWKHRQSSLCEYTCEQLGIDISQPSHKKALDLLTSLNLIAIKERPSRTIYPTSLGRLLGKLFVILNEDNFKDTSQFFLHRKTLTGDELDLIPVHQFLKLMEEIIDMLLIEPILDDYYFMPNPLLFYKILRGCNRETLRKEEPVVTNYSESKEKIHHKT